MSNWIPSEVGGGPDRYEATHAALRAAVGTLAGPQDGLEDAWRRLKAATLVDAASYVELAAMQALPAFSTVHVPAYEYLLRVNPSPSATEEDRRQRITQVWTSEVEVNIPALTEALMTLSPRLGATAVPYEYVTTTRPGRYYRPIGQPSLNYPKFQNFSTAYYVLVTYAPQFGETIVPEELRTKVIEFLSKALPAWVDWNLHVGNAGFYTNGGLDGTSLLNSKLLGP